MPEWIPSAASGPMHLISACLPRQSKTNQTEETQYIVQADISSNPTIKTETASLANQSDCKRIFYSNLDQVDLHFNMLDGATNV